MTVGKIPDETPRHPPSDRQPNQMQGLWQENMRLQQRYHEQQLEILKLKQEIQRLSSIVSGGRPSNYHGFRVHDGPSFAPPNTGRDYHKPLLHNVHTPYNYEGSNFAPPNIVRDFHKPPLHNAHTPSDYEGYNFAPPNIVRDSHIPHPPPPPYRQPPHHRILSHLPSGGSFPHASPYPPPAQQNPLGLPPQAGHEASRDKPADQAVAEHEVLARDIPPELGGVTEEQINEIIRLLKIGS